MSLEIKENEKAKSFDPQLGATIPPSLNEEAFPQPLTSEIPLAKRDTYLKFKGQVLIIDPMIHKIADMFPRTKD